MKRTLSAIFPNGSSKRERDELRRSWFEKYGNPYTGDGNEWSPTIRRLDSELSALSMLDSCFAYGGVEDFYAPHEPWEYCGAGSHYDRYLERFLKLGGTKSEFDRAIAAQVKYYDKCKVVYAGTDGEGVSYNAIVEK